MHFPLRCIPQLTCNRASRTASGGKTLNNLKLCYVTGLSSFTVLICAFVKNAFFFTSAHLVVDAQGFEDSQLMRVKRMENVTVDRQKEIEEVGGWKCQLDIVCCVYVLHCMSFSIAARSVACTAYPHGCIGLGNLGRCASERLSLFVG